MLQVEEHQRAQEGYGHLPGTALPPRKPTRDDEEHEAQECDERRRDAAHPLRCERADQRVALIGQDGVEHAEEPRGSYEPGEYKRAAQAIRGPLAPGQCARDPRERGRDINRLPPRGGVEGLMRGHLPDDQK